MFMKVDIDTVMYDTPTPGWAFAVRRGRSTFATLFSITTPYEGDESFLADATPATTALWEQVMAGIRVENATHAPVDFDTNVATSITAHAAGYINQPLERSSACKRTSR